jgi:fructokinase
MPSNQSLPKCVAGIGEVLMDVFENGEATVGGAPFNVIFHLNQLMNALSMGEAEFLSAVGPDVWGRHIRTTLANAGISTDYLAEVRQATGSALVFEQDGGAGFEIQPNVAWDFIELNNSALDLARRCNATVFGSLAQRSEISRSSIREFVSSVNGHRLYDVNLRRNTKGGVAGYNAEIITSSLDLATVVKMNDVELEEVGQLLGFSPKSSDPQERSLARMDWLYKEFSLQAVAVTRGAKGALLVSEEEHFALPDSNFDQAKIHPVGAGDSFAAGLLFGIMQGWVPEDSLQLANILSSWVVQHVSATPPLAESVLTQIGMVMERASATTSLRAS